MNITADAVKQLRERTGAGMMECKKALVETKGDLDAAAEIMRKQGLAKADKKASRVAAEGVIVIEKSADGTRGAHGRSEQRDGFRRARAGFPRLRAGGREGRRWPRAADTSKRCWPRSSPAARRVDERRRALIAKIGENISVRRFALLSAPTASSARTCTARASARWSRSKAAMPTLARDLAMHVAASNPRYLTPADVAGGHGGEGARDPDRAGADERQGSKPPEIVAKMVEGRLRKSLNEITLAGQPFVKDPDVTIEKLLKDAKAKVDGFERFEVGAGIEKKQEDFVAEVMAQVKGSGRPRRSADQALTLRKPRLGGVFSCAKCNAMSR